MIILPYKLGSEGARSLAEALQCKRSSRPINRRSAINWGRQDVGLVQTINSGEAVGLASDKISCLNSLTANNIPTIEWTTDREVAQQWWDDGDLVFCRTLTRANGGRGIVLADKETNVAVVPARLYTKYFKNKEEYRVHVGVKNGEAVLIFGQQKKKQLENGNVSYRIRNHENGWVFCTEGVDVPAPVLDAAKRAVLACGLDFGAVDVGYRVRDNTAAVFEINTAPGIVGKTVNAYAQFFKSFIGE